MKHLIAIIVIILYTIIFNGYLCHADNSGNKTDNTYTLIPNNYKVLITNCSSYDDLQLKRINTSLFVKIITDLYGDSIILKAHKERSSVMINIKHDKNGLIDSIICVGNGSGDYFSLFINQHLKEIINEYIKRYDFFLKSSLSDDTDQLSIFIPADKDNPVWFNNIDILNMLWQYQDVDIKAYSNPFKRKVVHILSACIPYLGLNFLENRTNYHKLPMMRAIVTNYGYNASIYNSLIMISIIKEVFGDSIIENARKLNSRAELIIPIFKYPIDTIYVKEFSRNKYIMSFLENNKWILLEEFIKRLNFYFITQEMFKEQVLIIRIPLFSEIQLQRYEDKGKIKEITDFFKYPETKISLSPNYIRLFNKLSLKHITTLSHTDIKE